MKEWNLGIRKWIPIRLLLKINSGNYHVVPWFHRCLFAEKLVKKTLWNQDNNGAAFQEYPTYRTKSNQPSRIQSRDWVRFRLNSPIRYDIALLFDCEFYAYKLMCLSICREYHTIVFIHEKQRKDSKCPLSSSAEERAKCLHRLSRDRSP